MLFYNLKREAAMFFASSLSSVVREANSVAGFGLDPEFAETLSALLAKCRAAGLDFRISQGAAHAPEASRVLLPLGTGVRPPTSTRLPERWKGTARHDSLPC
jgi:hypothetical protein